jgi:hypothetical protein
VAFHLAAPSTMNRYQAWQLPAPVVRCVPFHVRLTLAAFLRLNVTESQGMVDHAAAAGTYPVDAAVHASAWEAPLIAESNVCNAVTILFHSVAES